MLLAMFSYVLGWFCYLLCHRSLLGCGASGVAAVWKRKGKEGCPPNPQNPTFKNNRTFAPGKTEATPVSNSITHTSHTPMASSNTQTQHPDPVTHPDLVPRPNTDTQYPYPIHTLIPGLNA